MLKKEFLKKYLGYLIPAYLLLVIILFLFFVKTDYEVIVPGPTTDLNKVINIQDSKSNTNIYSVSVMDFYSVSLLDLMIAKLNKYALVEKENSYIDTSNEYQLSSGTIQKDVSITNAVIAGFDEYYKDDSPIEYEFKGFIVHSLYGDAEKYFEVGDIITGYKDKTLTPNYGLSQAILDAESIDSLKLNTDYVINLIRDEEELEVTAQCFQYKTDSVNRIMLGLSMYPYYEITSDVSNLYTIDYPSTTGPSAGLAMGLYIYDQLSNKNLTKDLTIVTTGTIEIDGTVGAIGGVESKVIAAIARQADYFFVPSDNYEDAIKVLNNENTSMKIIKVDKLTDAIDFLESLSDNNEK